MPGTHQPAEQPAERRSALVIATGAYADPELARLRAPARDAADLASVLADRRVGAFEVAVLADRAAHEIRLTVEDFLADRSTGDLLVVYLSCHGVLDARGRLYFAACDTRKNRLASTGVESGWLLDRLDECRARRQVLILDCCFSGAFAAVGAKGEDEAHLRRNLAGHGRGRVVLTASRASEYSFEGRALPGASIDGSVFTAGLVQGLRTGGADRDDDGLISVEDAYDYAYTFVQDHDAAQTPQRWMYGAEGRIWLAGNPHGRSDPPALDAPRTQAASSRRDRSRAPDTPAHLVSTLTAHTSAISAVAFSPDGTLLATAGHDKTLYLWDPRTRQLSGDRLEVPPDWRRSGFSAMSFSPDGTLLATAGHDNTVYLWDPHTRKPAGELLEVRKYPDTERQLTSLAFSPDGTLLATGSNDNSVRLWEVQRRQLVGMPLDVSGWERKKSLVTPVAFSPDGTVLATGSNDRHVQMWDSRTREPRGDLGHRSTALRLAFSPDGTLLATAGWNNSVRLWDPRTCQPHGEPLQGHVEWVTAVAFCPDGTLLATGSRDNSVRLWDPRTCQPYGEPLKEHYRPITAVVFSPDGTLLASGAEDNTVRLWELSRPAGHNPTASPFASA